MFERNGEKLVQHFNVKPGATLRIKGHFIRNEIIDEDLQELVDLREQAIHELDAAPHDAGALYRLSDIEAEIYAYDFEYAECDLHISDRQLFRNLIEAIKLDSSLVEQVKADDRLSVFDKRLFYYEAIGYDSSDPADLRYLLLKLGWNGHTMSGCYVALDFHEDGTVEYYGCNDDHVGTYDVIGGEVIIHLPTKTPTEYRGFIDEWKCLKVEGLRWLFFDRGDSYGC